MRGWTSSSPCPSTRRPREDSGPERAFGHGDLDHARSSHEPRAYRGRATRLFPIALSPALSHMKLTRSERHRGAAGAVIAPAAGGNAPVSATRTTARGFA